MIHTKFFGAALSIAMMVATHLNAAGTTDGRLDRIRKAVAWSLCYDVYWAGEWGSGEDYERGVPLPLKIVIKGENFYARIDPIGFIGKMHQPIRATRIGVDRGGQAVVTSNYEPDVNKHFVAGKVLSKTMTIPTDCTPRYDPPTPQKERMLQTVISTMQKQLNFFVRAGISKYPQEVILTIADFNPDYPSTYVLVEPPGNLYTVTLHNPRDWDSNLYEQQGEYPFREIRVKPYYKSLLEKIRRHGIVRTITLAPK